MQKGTACSILFTLLVSSGCFARSAITLLLLLSVVWRRPGLGEGYGVDNGYVEHGGWGARTALFLPSWMSFFETAGYRIIKWLG